MEFENLLKLIETVSSSELTHFSMKEGEFKLSMGKDSIVVSGREISEIKTERISVGAETNSEKKSQKELSEGKMVKAHLVGTFYSESATEEEPFVQVGDSVKKGQTLGIIEAMKLMNEIECEYDGVIDKILVENGQMIEYGQPLFTIK